MQIIQSGEKHTKQNTNNKSAMLKGNHGEIFTWRWNTPQNLNASTKPCEKPENNQWKISRNWQENRVNPSIQEIHGE